MYCSGAIKISRFGEWGECHNGGHVIHVTRWWRHGKQHQRGGPVASTGGRQLPTAAITISQHGRRRSRYKSIFTVHAIIKHPFLVLMVCIHRNNMYAFVEHFHFDYMSRLLLSSRGGDHTILFGPRRLPAPSLQGGDHTILFGPRQLPAPNPQDIPSPLPLHTQWLKTYAREHPMPTYTMAKNAGLPGERGWEPRAGDPRVCWRKCTSNLGGHEPMYVKSHLPGLRGGPPPLPPRAWCF